MKNYGTAIIDGTAGMTWLAWLLSNLNQINLVIQFFLLVIGVITGYLSLHWHYRRYKRENS